MVQTDDHAKRKRDRSEDGRNVLQLNSKYVRAQEKAMGLSITKSEEYHVEMCKQLTFT